MGTISHYLTMCVPIKKSHITDWIPKWLDVFWIYSYLILLHDLTKEYISKIPIYPHCYLNGIDGIYSPRMGCRKMIIYSVIYSHKYS